MVLLYLFGAWLPAGPQGGPFTGGSTAAGSSAVEERGTLLGEVRLLNRRGTRPARSVSPREVLVSFRPDDGARPRPETGARYEMATVDKAYTPSVMAVPKGAEVHFPNHDRILHNVFSVSGGNSFDLELMDGGESRSHVFTDQGLARIFCNVHRDMVGYIWVLETPHWTRPDADGRFRFEDLPLGSGTLTVWHPRATAEETDIEIVSRGPRRTFDLRITRPRLPAHTRKDGSAYRTRDRY